MSVFLILLFQKCHDLILSTGMQFSPKVEKPSRLTAVINAGRSSKIRLKSMWIVKIDSACLELLLLSIQGIV